MIKRFANRPAPKRQRMIYRAINLVLALGLLAFMLRACT